MTPTENPSIPFAVRKVCKECPFRTDTVRAQFSPDRFIALAETAKPGLLPGQQSYFACHKSPPGGERACAGFLQVVGFDSNAVRLAASRGRYNPAEIERHPHLYPSYRKMAEANGVPADHPALRGLPE